MRNPVHPGAILREDLLVELGLSVTEAAARLGVSRVALSPVLHEHARVTPNLVARLEAAGVGTRVPGLPCSSARDLAEERAAGTPKVRRLGAVASWEPLVDDCHSRCHPRSMTAAWGVGRRN